MAIETGVRLKQMRTCVRDPTTSNQRCSRTWLMEPRKEFGRMPRKPGGEVAVQARIAGAPGLSRADAHRLAGLLDAESHFAVSSNNRAGWRCYCAVALRDDDRELLQESHQRLGLGHLTQVPA